MLLFICGTDTNVGKTVVTGALAAWCRLQGLKTGVYKPLESGCAPLKDKPKKLRRPDSEFLARMAGIRDIDEVNSYAFRKPLAPGIAAEEEGVKVSLARIKSHLKKLSRKYDIVFIEGAGGLLVPVCGRRTNLDLITDLRCEVLIVGRLGLGTLNHTLMTYEILKSRGVKVKGVVLNQTDAATDPSALSNPGILKRYKLPVWGVFRHVKKLDEDSLIRQGGRLGRHLL